MHGIIETLITGDFPGFAITGVEEDSPIITLVMLLHGLFF